MTTRAGLAQANADCEADLISQPSGTSRGHEDREPAVLARNVRMTAQRAPRAGIAITRLVSRSAA